MASQAALVTHGDAIRGLADRWLVAVVTDPQVRDAGGDVACSPTGMWLALAAAAAGAGGDTAAELRGLLGTAGPEAAAAATAVADELARTAALGVATGVWARTPVYRSYRASLPGIGVGQLDPAAGVAPLAAWVRESTGGLVASLPLQLSSDTLLVLVNALVLKARWEEPFDAGATRGLPFTDAEGARHEVPTMRKRVAPRDVWEVRSDDGPPVAVLELRCAADGGLPAVVRCVLGAPGAPAEQALRAAWAGRDRWLPVEADQVDVWLPRLALRSRLAALPQLSRLGLRLAASAGADFSALSPEPLRIDQVAQECLLRVAEKGVVAAAVTMVAAVPAGAVFPPPRVRHLRFDRPFGVVVLDGTGTVPLFTAWQATAPVPHQ